MSRGVGRGRQWWSCRPRSTRTTRTRRVTRTMSVPKEPEGYHVSKRTVGDCAGVLMSWDHWEEHLIVHVDTARVKSQKGTFRQTNPRSDPFGEEPEYDVVCDLQEVRCVQILPARPINEEPMYADRDVPWSASEQGQKSPSTGNSNILPQCQQRELLHSVGPPVNRDTKPGRREKALDNTSVHVKTREQHVKSKKKNEDHKYMNTSRPCPPPPSSSDEITNKSPHEAFSRIEREATKRTGFRPNTKGRQRAETVSVLHKTQRHSLDLDSVPTEITSDQNLERVFSKRQHHEWPQTRKDFDQHEFVPMAKLRQTYCEGHWYVKDCNRIDAEHALHLVNTDGAFLVRDCSIKTNSEPLVLAVYHDKKVYNIKIRFIESTGKYALGQRSNDMFDSVTDVIKFHSIFPITLISGKSVREGKYPCLLTYAVTRRDVDQLLQRL
uniref:SH2 domain-containing protein n=1 Tax=Cynoglossus semilaevis TaxID=244447 RepID=A0A3P8UVU5_CYNSE